MVFTVNPAAAAKAGFTTDQLTTVASVDRGRRTGHRAHDYRRQALHAARALPGGEPRFARSHEQHGDRQCERRIGYARFRLHVYRSARARRKFCATICSRKRKSPGGSRASTWDAGVAAVQKAVNDLHLPPSIRVAYGGTYKEQQKSFHDLVVVLLLALVLIFLVLLFEFRSFSAPLAILSSAVLSTSGVFFALYHYAHRFQRRVLHGADHGARHRGQERNPAARRQSEIPRRSDSRRKRP